jgi:hypothetical protein
MEIVKPWWVSHTSRRKGGIYRRAAIRSRQVGDPLLRGDATEITLGSKFSIKNHWINKIGTIVVLGEQL